MQSRGPRALLAALTCSMLLFAAEAPAQDSTAVSGSALQLRWSAPSGCSSREDVLKDVRRLLGSAHSFAAALTADAKILPIAGGFELELELRAADVQRTRYLKAPTCDELAHAAAVVIASMLDPSLPVGGGESSASSGAPNSASRLEPAPTPSTACEPPKPCPVCVRAPSAPAQARRCEPRESASAPRTQGLQWLGSVGVAFGILPQMSPRFALGAGYRTQSFSAEATVSFDFATYGPRADGAGATFLLGAVAPRACYEWSPVGVCALFEVGVLRAAGFGVDAPQANSSLWFAPGVGVRLSHTLASGTRVALDVQGMINATSTRFELDGTTIHQSKRFIPAVRLSCAAWL